MPEKNSLSNAYDQLLAIPGIQIEPLDIICMVEQYRHYWKPDKVKVVLLAESYVSTS